MQMSGYAEECVSLFSRRGNGRILDPRPTTSSPGRYRTYFAVGQAKRRDNFASSGSVLLRYVISIKPR